MCKKQVFAPNSQFVLFEILNVRARARAYARYSVANAATAVRNEARSNATAVPWRSAGSAAAAAAAAVETPRTASVARRTGVADVVPPPAPPPRAPIGPPTKVPYTKTAAENLARTKPATHLTSLSATKQQQASPCVHAPTPSSRLPVLPILRSFQPARTSSSLPTADVRLFHATFFSSFRQTVCDDVRSPNTMTVLNVPPMLKSDKVPLVDPQPVVCQKPLEFGAPVRPRYVDVVKTRIFSWRAVVALALLVLLFGSMGCQLYRRRAAYVAAEEKMNAADTSNVLLSENDMLVVGPSDGDYDAGQFNPMEDVYRKIESFALGKGGLGLPDTSGELTPSVGDVISSSSDVLEVDDDGQGKPSPVTITRSARFIHDFSANVTGIVDVAGKRCFVMPLVRDAVSPPSSLYDLLLKMSSGYYTVDIERILDSMRVVKPAVEDLSDYGVYISNDCANYATFKLEKIVVTPATDAALDSSATADDA